MKFELSRFKFMILSTLSSADFAVVPIDVALERAFVAAAAASAASFLTALSSEPIESPPLATWLRYLTMAVLIWPSAAKPSLVSVDIYLCTCKVYHSNSVMYWAMSIPENHSGANLKTSWNLL